MLKIIKTVSNRRKNCQKNKVLPKYYFGQKLTGKAIFGLKKHNYICHLRKIVFFRSFIGGKKFSKN
jgi:hypothetical protein